ncbi:hypothetical protein Bpfe_031323 [Biomphalaria pfeifferi]|uniref:Uncharacterized protein n=1 Tax=Biomphalaria pfeifferi TaxID=112525 RepID=A0AAD8APN5_BIOPF|nr:hypothetical protein Bpfe_031323 [Biomphalaria pfeifferi]
MPERTLLGFFGIESEICRIDAHFLKRFVFRFFLELDDSPVFVGFEQTNSPASDSLQGITEIVTSALVS